MSAHDTWADGRALRLVLLLVLALAVQLPVLTLMGHALAPVWRYPDLLPSQWTLDAVADVLASARVRKALATSLTLAAATAIAASVIGFTVARAVHRARGWPRRIGAMAAFLPVVAPPIALGAGLQVAALRLGVAGSWVGVWLAHLIPASGYVAVYFAGVLKAYDSGYDEVARALGATPRQVMWQVTAPILRPRWIDALWLGALVSWGQLALSLLVGGGAVRTLPVELLAVLRAGDDHVGAVASLLLAVVPVLASVLTRVRWRTAGPLL